MALPNYYFCYDFDSYSSRCYRHCYCGSIAIATMTICRVPASHSYAKCAQNTTGKHCKARSLTFFTVLVPWFWIVTLRILVVPERLLYSCSRDYIDDQYHADAHLSWLVRVVRAESIVQAASRQPQALDPVICVCVCICAHTETKNVCVYIYIYIYLHICTYVHNQTHIRTNDVHISVYMCTHTMTCLLYAFMCLHLHMHLYIYVCMRIYIYIYNYV